MKMQWVVETCRLSDGFTVEGLRHYRCQACGSRFFDTDAMHRIQSERNREGAGVTSR